jgi:signal transduction histidine kinase
MDCGMGLSNINSRINSLNGDLDIRSSKGKGMTAVVKVNVRGATRMNTTPAALDLQAEERKKKRRK